MKQHLLFLIASIITFPLFSQFDPGQVIIDNYIKGISVSDLNGDGLDDILAGDNLRNIDLYINQGNLVFADPIEIDLGNNVRVDVLKTADLDNDNDIDIVLASKDASYIAWIKNIDGVFDNLTILYEGTSGDAYDLEVNDFNNDNFIDIAFYTSNGTLGWLENSGNGLFEAFQAITLGGLGSIRNILKDPLTSADFNNDGDIDLAFAGGRFEEIFLLNNDGNGSFIASELPSTDNAKSITSGDFNQDGLVDLFYVTGSELNATIEWLENLGAGSFSNSQIFRNRTGALGLIIEDVNLDGLADVLCHYFAFSGENGIQGYLSAESGYETIEISEPATQNLDYNEFYLSDFNRDGDLDLIAGEDNGGSKIVLFENILDSLLTTTLIPISGKVFYDENENGIQDQTELGLGNRMVNALPNGITALTNSTGDFTILVDSGIYNIGISEDTLWELTTLFQDTMITVTDTSTIDSLIFGLSPTSIIHELSVDMESGPFRCNDRIRFYLTVTNNGLQTVAGSVKLYGDDLLEFIEEISFPSPDSYNETANIFDWSFEDLSPGASFNASLFFEIKNGWVLGDSVYFNAVATILSDFPSQVAGSFTSTLNNEQPKISICHCTGAPTNPYVLLELPYSATDGIGNSDHGNHNCDIVPIFDINNDGLLNVEDCNAFQPNYDNLTFSNDFTSTIRCSYDPNDKLADPVGFGDDHLTLVGQELLYTIRFQNVGNDTAFDVVIVDTLDSDLDISTFQVVTTSHDVLQTSISGIENKVLQFNFPNIQLPDSNVDLTGSNGLVKYKIRPKQNLLDSTLIENQAAIFFDLNDPIITNSVYNTMVYNIPDSINPEAICKTIFEAYLDDNGITELVPYEINLSSNDNIGIVDYALDQLNFDCSHLGENNILLTVFDPEGNSDFCSTIVHIRDTISPQINCQNLLIEIEPTATYTLSQEDVVAGILDNCSIQSVHLSQTVFSNSDVGINPIIVTVTDSSENEVVCNINIEVSVISNLLQEQYGINVNIGPNPFSDYTLMTLSKNLPFNYDVIITDINGQTKKEFINNTETELRIDMQNLSAGMHFLRILENGTTKVLSSYKLVAN